MAIIESGGIPQGVTQLKDVGLVTKPPKIRVLQRTISRFGNDRFRTRLGLSITGLGLAARELKQEASSVSPILGAVANGLELASLGSAGVTLFGSALRVSVWLNKLEAKGKK